MSRRFMEGGDDGQVRPASLVNTGQYFPRARSGIPVFALGENEKTLGEEGHPKLSFGESVSYIDSNSNAM